VELLYQAQPESSAPSLIRLIALAGGGLLLAIVLPFATVVLAVVAGLEVMIWIVQQRARGWAALSWGSPRLIALMCLGGPYLLYQYWVIQTDSVFALWNAQNLTLTPPFWDLLIAFSPALLFAVWGAWTTWRTPATSELRRAALWLVAAAVLITLPVNLQRRFLLGLFIPAALLAMAGLRDLAARHAGLRRLGWVFAASVPTLLLLYAGAIGAALTGDPLTTLSAQEAAAFDWINANTAPDALILAAPETGNFLPAWTGRRVLYGHPFETVHAKAQEQAVTDFYAGEQPTGWSQRLGVDYIFFGARERALQSQGTPLDTSPLKEVYRAVGKADEVVIVYQVEGAMK